LYKEEFFKVQSSTDIIGVTKSARACSTHGRMGNVYTLQPEKLKRRDHLGELSTDGRILKYILKNYVTRV
jgi:hypothetical protein